MIIEQIQKIVSILNGTQLTIGIEKQKLIDDGLNRLAEGFDKDKSLQWHLIINESANGKYHKLNKGRSGVFMIGKDDGEIYNIKGYGTPDKNKKLKANLGKITDYNTVEEVKYLISKQYNYLR